MAIGHYVQFLHYVQQYTWNLISYRDEEPSLSSYQENETQDQMQWIKRKCV